METSIGMPVTFKEPGKLYELTPLEVAIGLEFQLGNPPDAVEVDDAPVAVNLDKQDELEG